MERRPITAGPFRMGTYKSEADSLDLLPNGTVSGEGTSPSWRKTNWPPSRIARFARGDGGDTLEGGGGQTVRLPSTRSMAKTWETRFSETEYNSQRHASQPMDSSATPA